MGAAGTANSTRGNHKTRPNSAQHHLGPHRGTAPGACHHYQLIDPDGPTDVNSNLEEFHVLLDLAEAELLGNHGSAVFLTGHPEME